MQAKQKNEADLGKDRQLTHGVGSSSRAANWAAVSLATLCLSLPLGSCGESDREYLNEARILQPKTDAESLERLLDVRIQVEVSGFEKLEAITAQQGIYERQLVFGPHYDLVDGEWEMGWYWGDVKVGEKTVETGAWFKGVEDPTGILFKASGGNYPQEGDSIVAGNLGWDSDRGAYVIENPRFINPSELEK